MLNPDAIQLMNRGLWLVLVASGPPILLAAAAGLVVAILQAATQLQEQTTQYAAKFAAVVIALALFGATIGSAIYRYTDQIFSNFPGLIRP